MDYRVDMGSSMIVQPLVGCHCTCTLINWSVLRQPPSVKNHFIKVSNNYRGNYGSSDRNLGYITVPVDCCSEEGGQESGARRWQPELAPRTQHTKRTVHTARPTYACCACMVAKESGLREGRGRTSDELGGCCRTTTQEGGTADVDPPSYCCKITNKWVRYNMVNKKTFKCNNIEKCNEMKDTYKTYTLK